MTILLTKAEKSICYGYQIKPHPDGKPWAKCCESGPGSIGLKDTDSSCQCFMRKPKIGPSRYEGSLMHGSSHYSYVDELRDEKGRFFCAHCTDGEYHRECAGWAAKITGNKP